MHRDPEIYLNYEFLARCNGLPIVWKHPEKNVLDTKTHAESVIGTILLPYIKGDEVWGIGRVIDLMAGTKMATEQWSTSPGVVFAESSGNVKVPLADDSSMLIEGNPVLIDHLAICENGVWDKDGPPEGVQVDNPIEVDMPAEIHPEVLALLNGIADGQKTLMARIDSVEKNMPAPMLASAADARKDAEEKEEKERADRARKDAEEKEEKAKADARKDAEEKEAKAKADSEEKEKEEAARKDAEEKERMDASKKDEDEAAYADSQARADAVYQLFGKSAPRPMEGERLMAYRQRLVRAMQPHSSTWKASDLKAIGDAVAFNLAESAIYADAAAASNTVGAESGGSLRAIRRRDPDTGHNITTFAGKTGAWMEDFKAGVRVGKFVKKEQA